MKKNIAEIKRQLRTIAKTSRNNPTIFFKTGTGDYAEHDRFIGVPVPILRKIANQFSHLSCLELQELLASCFNEERLLSLLILIIKYQKANNDLKNKLYDFYLRNLKHVNNWNLVDASAHLIIGAHLIQKERDILLQLSRSKILWERRISMVATWTFIKRNDFEWTTKIATILLNDKHDLIHKAVGWMLREAGKRNESILTLFLEQHASYMPRTMLRYAIEKFPEEKRKLFLAFGI